MAYGRSQARGRVTAYTAVTAVGGGPKPCLGSTPQLMAMLDPSPTE